MMAKFEEDHRLEQMSVVRRKREMVHLAAAHTHWMPHLQ
jgi:hypothetical protein